MARVFIGIGSNEGDRQAFLDMARAELGIIPQTRLVGWSKVYETDPVGPVPQGKFLNAAAELDSRLEPTRMLGALDKIETKAGREPVSRRTAWGPRVLDLDILLYGDLIISRDDLVIPHPLMHERYFVLKPLADLNPNAVHPILEMTVGALLNFVTQQEDSDPDARP